MLVSVVLGLAWSRVASLILVVASLGWVHADVQPEGAVLLEITGDHGIVLADLYGLFGVVVGTALLVRGPGRRPGRRLRPRESRPPR